MSEWRETIVDGFPHLSQDVVFECPFHRTPSLRLLLGFRANRRGDVAAHLRDSPAVCCCQRVETLTLYGFARDSAARAGLPVCNLAHRPHRLDRRLLAL